MTKVQCSQCGEIHWHGDVSTVTNTEGGYVECPDCGGKCESYTPEYKA